MNSKQKGQAIYLLIIRAKRNRVSTTVKSVMNTRHDPGDSECETILEQLYLAYAESHESDPPEIRNGFKELDALMDSLPLNDNNAVWNLCCQLCTAYEHKAFLDGLY